MSDRHPPFRIIAFAPLASEIRQVWTQPPIEVDAATIDQALTRLTPEIYVELPPDLSPAGGITVHIRSSHDFNVDGLLASQSYLQDLLAADLYLAESRQNQRAFSAINAYFSARQHLPLKALQAFTSAQPQPGQGQQEKADLAGILSMVDIPQAVAPETSPSISSSYRAIALSVVEHILNDAAFRRLASAWFGLDFLCRRLSGSVQLAIIPADLENLPETLAQHRQGLNTLPPDLLLLDIPLGSSNVSMDLLAEIAACAYDLLTPALAWVEPSFLHLRTWEEMDGLAYLPHRLDGPEYARYRKFRVSAAGSWVQLSCNRPAAVTGPADSLSANRSRQKPVWISPVWAVAALVCQRLAQSGLPAAIAGQRKNPLALPAQTTMEPGSGSLTETLFSAHRVEQLVGCGIVPLVELPGQNQLFLPDSSMAAKHTSLDYQFLVSMLIHLVLQQQEKAGSGGQDEDLSIHVARVIKAALVRRCGTNPGEIVIELDGPTTEQGTPLHISWWPSAAVLPATPPIKFQFLWQ